MSTAKIISEIKAQLAAKLGSELTETDLHGLSAGLYEAAHRKPLFSRTAGGVIAAERWATAYALGAENAERYWDFANAECNA
jgi:hypothetical protein